MAGKTDSTTPRERYRAQVRAEIKEHAWDQIGTAGASALSLNAIAKLMGMSGPALYRYFANRDELITELIRDAYQSLAETMRTTAARAPDGTPDLPALAASLRTWALTDPQRYLLIYGTPIPGYHAPDDITAISAEIMGTVLDACAAMPYEPAETPFAGHLATHGDWARGHPAPPAVLHRALTAWTRLHGVLSLELAGHFRNMGFDPAELYAAEVAALTEP
ncbi:TetR family transcriptional regulator [Streptomyces sp. WAC 06738]|uniref:TetR/AcrR family transcriptional regulator n=1 Tax=Streptomyces sp. WAC 06738 TaxID=2203210 RepID=UPI000F6DE407|nr:TetR/AcrR family transcriptional regulator [Streptomyces sp. WAC 06738]AZM48417.1 TetR family transcriptional regulator [Streptomyces sp. WAC 06738]